LGHLAPDVGLNEAALALATAVALDALDEARARRAHGLLVPVANEHDPAALAGRLAALREAGIPAHARGAHHRALYQLYAPYVPIALYVPAGRERAARAALGLPDEGAPLSFGS
ncbi:MAG TPA: hypothetical protein VFS00_03505, partial [Polyangiaceae bacterium]|nr:hypothetical protein [Polyangiaceae bacterium]